MVAFLVAELGWAHGLRKLWLLGLVASRHMESPWTRDLIHVPCIDRGIFFFFLNDNWFT